MTSIQLTREFDTNSGTGILWQKLTDPVALGHCIPGCESVTVIDDLTSKWVVKITVGVISRKIDAKARILEKNDELKTMVIRFDSKEGDFVGKFKVRVEEIMGEKKSSKIILDSEMDARGSFQWIINQVIKSQLDKFSYEFIKCISQ